MAPRVAELMAKELDAGQAWVEQQVADFQDVAQNYVIKDAYLPV